MAYTLAHHECLQVLSICVLVRSSAKVKVVDKPVLMLERRVFF